MNLTPIQANMTVLTFKDGTEVLFSYQTPVAAKFWNRGAGFTFVKTSKKWSATTTRHINKWMGSFIAGAHVSEMPQEFFDNLMKEVA